MGGSWGAQLSLGQVGEGLDCQPRGLGLVGGSGGSRGYLSRGRMAVVPFPTTVPKSCSSATCPQTRSPTGQRGSQGPEWIKHSGRVRVSRRALCPSGEPLQGSVLLSVEWAWRGRGQDLLGHFMAGKPLVSRTGHHRHQESQKPALGLLGLGSGIFSALPLGRLPSSPCL